MRLPVRLVRQLINYKIPLVTALEKLETGHSYHIGRPCFCPFHDNTNTPAAALYAGEDHDSLWCFAEQKLYTSVDVIEKLRHKDIYTIAEVLWSQMSEEEQAAFISKNSEDDLQLIFAARPGIESTREVKRLEALYVANKIGPNELLLGILRAAQEASDE